MKKIVVTGGAGFIGSALVRYLVSEKKLNVLVIDKLTYAGNLESLNSLKDNPGLSFLREDIANTPRIKIVVSEFQPDAIMHLAAETHVDRSIDSAASFIHTNLFGTYSLLEIAREYWQALPAKRKANFIFHHVSTDEVFGDLTDSSTYFTEKTAYAPSSPYSATKAGSDHLVRSWYRTYGLPVIITNCSNNYGPYHFPEKLIPLIILNAIEGKPLPVYGKGNQVRDWLCLMSQFNHDQFLIKFMRTFRIIA